MVERRRILCAQICRLYNLANGINNLADPLDLATGKFANHFILACILSQPIVMRTYKNHGGDIHAKSAFQKILSIGYEMETVDLAKLTLMSDGVFLNTDTATKDVAKINDPNLSEDNINFQEYIIR